MFSKLKTFFAVTVVLLISGAANAAKPFYDSKSWIANVAGDYQLLLKNGFESKVNPLNISINYSGSLNVKPSKEVFDNFANDLQNENASQKILNALTYNGKSEELLKKLALLNIQRQDEEFGVATARAESGMSVRDIVAEDYLPILMNNYIVADFTYTERKSGGKTNTKKYYAIYQLMITKEEAFDIMSCIGDAQRYSRLSFPISLVSYGEVKIPDTNAVEEIDDKLASKISKEVPGLAVRGVLLRRHPARISLGENEGIHKGDLVSIYSQRMDKDGNPYSKRISRARVCGVWDDEAQINFEANTAGNRKNGDIVVRTPDSKTRFGIMATYSPHLWGGRLIMDGKSGFTRSGIIHHLLVDLGFTMTDKPGTEFYAVKNNMLGKYNAPMFFDLGIGYGLGKTFLGFMDIMPFFIAQFELGTMFDASENQSSTTVDTKIVTGCAVKIPVGLRLSFNIGYPVKIFVEGGYAPKFGFGEDYKIVKQACNFLNVKQSNVFVNLGLMF